MHRGALAKLREAELRVLDVPAHGEVGAIDLQHDAGRGDRLIFVAHRIGDGEQIGLLARIVVVAEEQRDDAGRRRAHERVAAADRGERGLEIVDIGLGRIGVADGDGSVAGGRLAPRASGVAEDALGEVGELGEILVDEGVARAAEAHEPVLDVGGIARLRHFAVVDDVDAGIDLLAHHLSHRCAHARGERVALDRHALLLGVHQPDQIVGPRQAAGMSRQKSVGAADHRALVAQAGA